MPPSGPSHPHEPPAAAVDVGGMVPALRRLMLSIAVSQFGISIVYGAVPGVLLALLGAVAALIAQPLAGSLSDRTHTRLGNRTPYVLGGSLWRHQFCGRWAGPSRCRSSRSSTSPPSSP
ncbi:hypothetical protein ACLMAJ_28545 [Nocardia sp. KC 131]|uniref:hypothetical protein n=1 Tax=Nocardia arseniciresistens TaxID=3392119 RepID=UPI00398E5484